MDDNSINLDQGRGSELAEIKALVLENNKILKGIRRSARVAAVWRFFYWILIIGSIGTSYYYLQPYLDSASKAYKNLEATQQKVQSFNFDSLKNYFSPPTK